MRFEETFFRGLDFFEPFLLQLGAAIDTFRPEVPRFDADMPAQLTGQIELIVNDLISDSVSTENEILRLLCANTKFKMAELWSFGNGSTGLDASISTAHFRDKCVSMRLSSNVCAFACVIKEMEKRAFHTPL